MVGREGVGNAFHSLGGRAARTRTQGWVTGVCQRVEKTQWVQRTRGAQRPSHRQAPLPAPSQPTQLLTAAVCVAWMLASSALILLNKDLLAGGFHYPMALSALGMSFSAVASFICCRVINVVDARRGVITPRAYATRVLPVGLLMAATLHFGNVVYLYLTVSFIQMLKALTPVVTMAALFAARLESPTPPLIASVAAIAAGTAVASYGEVNLSLVGLACMFASECFEAGRLVLTQSLLAGANFHPVEGLMYLAPACTAWLLLGSAAFELPRMRAEGAWALVTARPAAFSIAAATGFAVNALAYGVISRSSSLTLKVLGTVKNAGVVWWGVLVLGDIVTPVQGIGYALSLAGFLAYNKAKMAPATAGYAGLPTRDPGAVKG